MKRVYYILILLLLFSFSSCKKFLDVKPKTQVESSVAFEDEKGYQQALTGIYVKMTDKSLYGKELTFGMLDVLGRQYNSIKGVYINFDTYNYQLDTAKIRIAEIWKKTYNGVANANNLIANLERADLPQFTGVNYKVIKGETLGLRAFLHFDLLRLFAPAPASVGGMDALAIPYVTRFSSQNASRGNVRSVIGNILTDLNNAAELLKISDPIVAGNPAATNYLRDRYYKFNYYAVKALLARVYLYAGDKVNALTAAQEVINSGVFPFASSTSITSGQNKIFLSELIFALNMNDLHTYALNYFGNESQVLAKRYDDARADFDLVLSDYRYTILSSNTAGNVLTYSNKYLTNTGTPLGYLYKMPIIRVSEMYYIASECLIQSNRAKSLEYLNAVRHARNLSADVPPTVTDAELQNQIFREYRRDFIAEGQLFYYYKRLNAPNIEYTTVRANNSVYVLPLPEDELKYGN